jgi:uncharacterized repeat protein (TIGR01451 family)
MLHRFDLDGKDLGRYDHGVTALGAAGLPAVAFNAANRPNIASDRFDSEQPASWGFAPPARRVWGLAVQADRLFYSTGTGAATDAPQIWSVGIQRDGSFAADARLELNVPAQPGPYPVSDIAFSQNGAMIVAQRAPIAASYDYLAFTRPGEPRVLRFRLKDPNDPPSPGLWKPAPEEYAVGLAGGFRNTNGGVALGYGYGQDGMLGTASCEGSLWTTGENLRNNPALSSQLEPGGPLPVLGLQGSSINAVRPANAPPAASYFIDYDDKFDDARDSGHMGSIRIFSIPCAAANGQVSAANPPYVSGATTPPNNPPCIGANCTPCPFGSYPDGACKPPVDLAIAKTAGEAKFDEKTLSWTITFTLTVTNVGAPFSPMGPINISDPIPAGLTVTSATGPGWSPCSGNLQCAYNFGSGVFATNATLPPLTITITTKTPGTYTNCAMVGMPASSGFHETTLDNNRACATVVLTYPPNNVTVTKISPTEPCAVESPCTFQLVVTNSSPWPFNGPVTFGDTSTIPMNVASTDLPCTPAPTAIPFTCTGTVTLPAGVSSQTFTVTGVIPAGSIPLTSVTGQNCAVLTQAPPIPGFPSTIVLPPGPDCKPYTACGFACHMTQPQIDQIKIDKAANQTECSPGGLCSYTFTITNLSTTTATSTFPIAFIDTMPPGASTFVPPPTPAPWTCLPLGGNPDKIKCLYPPSSIPPGGTLTVTVTFRISPSYTQPTLQNCSEFYIGQPATLALQRRTESAMDEQTLRSYLKTRGIAALPASASPALHPDDRSCTTVNITPSAPKRGQGIDLAIVKTGGTSPAPQVNAYAFHLAVKNVGSAFNGTAVITVTDVVPSGMTFNSATGTNWSCATLPASAGSSFTCTYTGAGPTASNQALGTIDIMASALSSAPFPPFTNCATVGLAAASGLTDTKPADNTSCVTVTKPVDCAPPLLPGAVAGQCICPQGMVLRGKECIKQAACQPPMVPGPVAGQCICPQGSVQRGKSCVQPIVCNPPAKLNRRGACECPTDMVARGNSCVERERRQPQITPGDIIRTIPGGGRDDSRGNGREDPRGPGRDKPAMGGGQGSADMPGRR